MCSVKYPGASRMHGLRAWGRHPGTQPVQDCASESRKTLGLGGGVGPSVVGGAACNSQQPRLPGRNRILQNFPAHPPALNPRLTPPSSSPLEPRPSTPESFTHLAPARRDPVEVLDRTLLRPLGVEAPSQTDPRKLQAETRVPQTRAAGSAQRPGRQRLQPRREEQHPVPS